MPDKNWTLSPFENGMPGLHLIINPQQPLPPETRIYRQFMHHNLTLSNTELQSLLSGRDAGIATVNHLMSKLMPGFSSNTRLKLSTQIADALFDYSLSAQLAREAPTTQERLRQRDELLQQVFQQPIPPGDSRGQPPRLLQQVPVGVSLTLHF
jgi:hypothetical protein